MLIENLNNKIVKCQKCPRLVKFRKKISIEKRKEFINQTYWGKPITGFGDIKSKILLVGLAPAAHGGNRTGRVFTGDKSSDFLYKCLYKVKMSNQPNSTHLNDGLKLKKSYITTALKCVPPEDKPTKEELLNCFKYFKEEINCLKNIKIILALGKIAFDSIIQFYNIEHKIKPKNYKFSHGGEFVLPEDKILVGCYHPSPRNVNTGRIDFKKFVSLLKSIKNKLNNE